MSGDSVGRELVRVDDLDACVEESGRGSETGAGVVGDDGIALPEERCLCDVAIVWVAQPVLVVPVLGGIDLGAGEGPLHLREQRFAVGGAVLPSSLGIESREHVVQLDEDPRTPQRRVGFLGCELEKEVALPPRHQGAGVEDGAVHVRSLSELPDAADPVSAGGEPR